MNGFYLKPIAGFRKAWVRACIQAGLCEMLKDTEGKAVVVKDKKGNEKVVNIFTKIFHDFRRTAIRDMVRSGVSELWPCQSHGTRPGMFLTVTTSSAIRILRKLPKRNRLTLRNRIWN